MTEISQVLYCDGITEGFGVYTCKMEAYINFIGCNDALNVHLMKKCLTKLEYDTLDLMKP
jgi:hypothetical protein